MMAGDVRAQENPGLTALQTLFVCEPITKSISSPPNIRTGTVNIFIRRREARAIVGAEIAHITYDEFLPKLLRIDSLTTYHGFEPTVDPRITEEFAASPPSPRSSRISAKTKTGCGH